MHPQLREKHIPVPAKAQREFMSSDSKHKICFTWLLSISMGDACPQTRTDQYDYTLYISWCSMVPFLSTVQSLIPPLLDIQSKMVIRQIVYFLGGIYVV